MVGHLFVQLRLHGLEQAAVDDGGLLAFQDLALEDDVADVEAVAQQIGEWAAGEGNAADRAAMPSERLSLVTMLRLRRSAITWLRLPSLR